MANSDSITLPISEQPDNEKRLAEIAARLTNLRKRRSDIDNLITSLQQERQDTVAEAMALTDEAWRLAPRVDGVRHEARNWMPHEFKVCEIAANAYHTPESNLWRGWVEELFDGATGASDPLWISEKSYPTPQEALHDANVKATEFARNADAQARRDNTEVQS